MSKSAKKVRNRRPFARGGFAPLPVQKEFMQRTEPEPTYGDYAELEGRMALWQGVARTVRHGTVTGRFSSSTPNSTANARTVVVQSNAGVEEQRRLIDTLLDAGYTVCMDELSNVGVKP